MSLKKSRFIKGIILAPDNIALDGIEGEIKVDSSTGKIQVTLKDGVNPSTSREIVTSSQTQTLTNKTLTSPVLDTGVSGSAIDTDGTLAANSDTKLASQKAVKTYVDSQIGNKDEADEIIYDNTTSGLVATNVQTAIDEVDGNVDNLVTLSGVALDSTTLGTFTGTTIPDDSTIKSAIQSLETSHESHTGSSVQHGVTSDLVGKDDIQSLTNKTIDADLNTISNIEDADIKISAAISRAKLASGTANRVVINDATGVQTDAAAITASRALISDANGIPTHSSVTSTELGHVSGVTSGIQTQLDGKVDEVGGTLTSGSVITPARLDVKQDTKANLTTYALTATNGQIVYATDTKEMFQVIDGLLEGIGGGEGVGGTDILFAQTFETAALTDFTQTGLSLSTLSPLHGEISALLTHDASVNQLFKQVIPVDNKFRNQTMVLRLDVKSNASAGNVVINIYDETNAANIVASEQLQLSNDVNGTKNSVGFTIPETCASLSYTITALPEAGSPVTRIDDIICELAETALLETAVEVPVVTSWQGYTPTFQGFGTPPAIEFEWRQVGENVEIRGKFTSGVTTAVEARVGLPAGLTSAGTSLIPSIQVVGKGNTNAVGATNFGGLPILIEPSVTYLTLGVENSTVSFITKRNASEIAANGTLVSFFASVPCAGLSATTTKTIPLTQSGLVQEGDSFILARGNAGQALTADVTDIPFIFNSSLGITGSWSGTAFTASQSGTYTFDFSVFYTTNATRRIAVYINGVQSYRLSESTAGISSGSINLYLNENDIVTLRSTAAGTLSNDPTFHFLRISRQGSLKQVSVNPNSKITIPTSELRFEGASSRGSTATAIVKFDTLAKIRGDAFTVESDSVLGTRITMKKAGKLDISCSLYRSASNIYLYISKNQSNLTTVPTASEALSSSGTSNTSNNTQSASWSGNVEVGDIIRIVSTIAPTVDSGNSLNLSFQEQDISVSVTNTLPQFSESDSCVRVTGGNGFTGQTRLFSNVIQNIGSDVQYTAASGQFRAMSSGIYNITYQEETAVSTNGPEIYIYVNETLTAIANDRINTAASLTRYPLASIQLYLSEGDIVTGRVIATATFPSISSYSSMTISKVGKPNVTGVDVTPFVNVPQPETAYARFTGSTAPFGGTDNKILYFNTNTAKSGSAFSITNTAANGTVITMLKSGKLSLFASLTFTGVAGYAYIGKNLTGVQLTDTSSSGDYNLAASYTAATSNNVQSVAWEGDVVVGDTFRVKVITNTAPNGFSSFTASFTGNSDQILTPPETFSTDTASLTYANEATYTPSTLANAPVGTYITFTYAGGGNTRIQTTGLNRPAQTDADMNANGILLYTRVFSVGSSSSQPAAIAIQIGKGMKGKSIDLYKSAGKLTSGSTDKVIFGVAQRGLAYQSYDEKTGILFLDAGECLDGGVTTHNFMFSDSTTQASGYLVINASKNPALTGLGLNRIAASVVQTSGQSIPNGTFTTVTYDSTKAFDTHGALNTSTGIFTAPEAGYYQVNAAADFTTASWTAGQEFELFIYKNGVQYRKLHHGQVQASLPYLKQMNGSDIVYLAKNDTLDIRVYHNRGAATSLYTDGNYLSIAKILV